jgi:hypothetical protein
MKELINRIKHDIKQAEIRRDAFEIGTKEYSFNQATIIALKTVLFDIKELRLTDED